MITIEFLCSSYDKYKFKTSDRCTVNQEKGINVHNDKNLRDHKQESKQKSEGSIKGIKKLTKCQL